MTRVAGSAAAHAPVHRARIDARWRVGVRGQLHLRVRSGPRPEQLVAEVSLGHFRWLFSGTCTVSMHEFRCEFVEVGAPENEGQPSAGSCTVALCTREGAEALLITNLPERLGIKGGTYVLESIRVDF